MAVERRRSLRRVGQRPCLVELLQQRPPLLDPSGGEVLGELPSGAITKWPSGSTPRYGSRKVSTWVSLILGATFVPAREVGPDRVVRLAQERRVRAGQQAQVADLGVEDPRQRDVARHRGRGPRGGAVARRGSRPSSR